MMTLLNYPTATVKFKTFKMADDAQAKQLAINLNSAGKISDQRLLSEFGYNYDQEMKAIENNTKEQLESQVFQAKKSAEAQGEAQIVATKYQVRAEEEAIQERYRIKLEMFQEELAAENVGVPAEHHQIIERYAQQVFNMDPASQNTTLQRMAQSMPTTHGFVLQRVQEMFQEQQMAQAQANQAEAQAEQAQAQAQEKQAPNQKEVGKREQDKVKIQGEKKKAPTKGNV